MVDALPEERAVRARPVADLAPLTLVPGFTQRHVQERGQTATGSRTTSVLRDKEPQDRERGRSADAVSVPEHRANFPTPIGTSLLLCRSRVSDGPLSSDDACALEDPAVIARRPEGLRRFVHRLQRIPVWLPDCSLRLCRNSEASDM